MRKSYIDNIRIICIFLLFPFHAAMCFNAFDELFYVIGNPNAVLSNIIVGVYPWWMSLLFALAGISSFYALQKRTAGQYAKERVLRILIPLLFGLMIIIPPQTYIGDILNCGYSGGYFEHYLKYFTTLTDWSGNDGCFTPGNLWFLLYLFLISMVTLPLMSLYIKRKKKPDFSKVSLIILIFAGIIIVTLMSFVLEIGDKGLGDFASCFLLGFFVLSDDGVLEKLKKHSIPLGVVWILLVVLRCVLWNIGFENYYVDGILYKSLEWIGIIAALGLGARFLNFRNGFTDYFSYAEFPMYEFHQTILVAAAFFIVPVIENTYAAFAVITVGSFLVTLAVYEIFRRIPATRFMFGIKKQKERG